MMLGTMTEKKFQYLLDAHGPDPAHWPAGQRRAAEALLARSAAAQAAWQEARALLSLLDAAAAADRVPEVAQIVANATAHVQTRPVASPIRRATGSAGSLGGWLRLPLPYRWAPEGALAFCLVLGLALGAILPSAAVPPRDGATTSEILGLAGGGAGASLAPEWVEEQ